MNNIIIFGAGEGGQELLRVNIEDINRIRPSWKVIGFIDKDIKKKGRNLHGYPIIGPTYNHNPTGSFGVCGVMDNSLREEIINKEILGNGLQLASLIHPSVVNVNDFVYDEGVIIFPGAKISYNVKLGKGVMVNYNCVLGHDLVIGDYSYLGPSVTISGQCKIGKSCTIGTGSTFLQGVSVGNYSTVGLGTTLIKNVGESMHAMDLPRNIEVKK